jgi:hypothetical protein
VIYLCVSFIHYVLIIFILYSSSPSSIHLLSTLCSPTRFPVTLLRNHHMHQHNSSPTIITLLHIPPPHTQLMVHKLPPQFILVYEPLLTVLPSMCFYPQSRSILPVHPPCSSSLFHPSCSFSLSIFSAIPSFLSPCTSSLFTLPVHS